MQTSARILLFTFVWSIALYPILEAGHAFLHTFENGIHYHTHQSKHRHSLVDHEVITIDNNHAGQISALGCDFLSLLFGAFKPVEKSEWIRFGDIQPRSTGLEFAYQSPDILPPTPPPSQV